MEIDNLNQLATLSNPQRMDVYQLLMRRYPNDVKAGEIATVLGIKPSTLSVYLSALVKGHLISKRRDGTALYYRTDMDGVRSMMDFLTTDCCNGRPDLCPPEEGSIPCKENKIRPLNVLFVCSGNSARSLMGEAFLNQLDGKNIRGFSAGTSPKAAPNPAAIATLERHGISTQALRCKPLSAFQSEDSPKIDFVFTLCDRAANTAVPSVNGSPLGAHWRIAEPSKAADATAGFENSYNILKLRISKLCALPFEQLDRAARQKAIDEIAFLDMKDKIK